MKYLPLLILNCVISFYGCDKEEKPYVPIQRCPDFTRNMDTINKYIHGTWDWKEEMRYDRNQNGFIYFTPKTPGWTTRIMRLFADTAVISIPNTPDSVFRFKIQWQFEITGFPTDSLPMLAYYSFYTGIRKNAIPIMICKNQLLMQNQFVTSNFGEDIWLRK
jgi:hypothetical protein